MDVQRTPNLRTQAMGTKLRELRIAAGIDTSYAGQHVGRDKSGISRMENGLIPIPPEVLETLLTLYGTSDPVERDGLLRFNREVWKTGWWDGYADQVGEPLIDHVWLEERATEILAFNIAAFDGLLQTSDYAREIMLAYDRDKDPDEVENLVDLRMRRQVILSRRPQASAPETGRRLAPHLKVIVSEAALRSCVGGPTVLAQQLRYVIERCQRNPSIEVRVVMFEDGSQASHVSDFHIFTMPEPFPQIVSIEAAGGIIYREPPGAEPIVASYHRLQTAALGPDESVAYLQAAADELENKT